jgi:hypothetical protein
VPDLRQPATGKLDVALAEGRLDLKEQDRLLDVKHLGHVTLTVAVDSRRSRLGNPSDGAEPAPIRPCGISPPRPHYQVTSLPFATSGL